MSLLTSINYLAVVVASITYFMLGFLWYSKLFGRVWQQETGVIAGAKPAAGALAGQFASTFLFSLGVAVVMRLMATTGVRGAVASALLVTVLFAVPINSGNLFFTGKRRLFVLDVTERALGALLVALIVSAFAA